MPARDARVCRIQRFDEIDLRTYVENDHRLESGVFGRCDQPFEGLRQIVQQTKVFRTDRDDWRTAAAQLVAQRLHGPESNIKSRITAQLPREIMMPELRSARARIIDAALAEPTFVTAEKRLETCRAGLV